MAMAKKKQQHVISISNRDGALVLLHPSALAPWNESRDDVYASFTAYLLYRKMIDSKTVYETGEYRGATTRYGELANILAGKDLFENHEGYEGELLINARVMHLEAALRKASPKIRERMYDYMADADNLVYGEVIYIDGEVHAPEIFEIPARDRKAFSRTLARRSMLEESLVSIAAH